MKYIINKYDDFSSFFWDLYKLMDEPDDIYWAGWSNYLDYEEDVNLYRRLKSKEFNELKKLKQLIIVLNCKVDVNESKHQSYLRRRERILTTGKGNKK